MTKTEMEQELSQHGFNLSEMFLDALVAAGVDNWDGYDEAIQIYKTWLKEEIENLTS